MTSPGAHGEGEGAVVLWKEFGYRPFLDGWNEDPAHKGGEDSVEGRWMPLDTYNALLARANTATVAADLMRARAERAEAALAILKAECEDGVRTDCHYCGCKESCESSLEKARTVLSTQRGEG